MATMSRQRRRRSRERRLKGVDGYKFGRDGDGGKASVDPGFDFFGIDSCCGGITEEVRSLAGQAEVSMAQAGSQLLGKQQQKTKIFGHSTLRDRTQAQQDQRLQIPT